MASDKENLRHCILFAFQFKKKEAEATEIIFSVLREDAGTHETCWSSFRDFAMVILTFPTEKDLVSRKNSKQFPIACIA